MTTSPPPLDFYPSSPVSLGDAHKQLDLSMLDSPSSPAHSLASSTAASALITPLPPCSISKPLEALQQHFELQVAQMQLVEQQMKTHFNSTLPGHLNPVSLLARLRLLTQELPQLAARHERVQQEKAAVLAEVATLVDSNKVLLKELQAKVQAAPAAQRAASSSPKASPRRSSPSTKSSSSSSIPPLALKSTRASTAPSASPITPLAPHRRKSMRASVAPPSPSALVEASLLEAISSSPDLEMPISEKEFAAVSTTVKSRVKLAEVNQMLTIIQTYFSRYVHAHKIKDGGASLPPLTLHTLAEEGGVKIGGASSQCIIGTLRACKRIVVGKNGINLVKPPVYGKQ